MKPVIAIGALGCASLITVSANAGWSFSRWEPVINSGTPGNLDLTWKTFDLYLKADTSTDTINFIDATNGLGHVVSVDVGVFYQHPFGTTLGAPTQSIINLFPDAEFDTYLAIGDATNLVTTQGPTLLQGGSDINGDWSVIPGVSPIQNPITLNWEVFIGRFTVDLGATNLGGVIDVGGTVVIPFGSRGGAATQDLINIPNAIPAPTALAPFTFAFLASRRRRNPPA